MLFIIFLRDIILDAVRLWHTLNEPVLNKWLAKTKLVSEHNFTAKTKH